MSTQHDTTGGSPDSLAKLNSKVIACRACPRLVRWREQIGAERRAAYADESYWARPLPGFGDPAARLVLVGLAPAAHGGNRTGRMFTGDRSGDFLFAALYRAGFANQPESVGRGDGLLLNDAYVTAAVRSAPPDNRPTPDERRNCAHFLSTEFSLMTNCSVLLALGSIAYEAIWRERADLGGHATPSRPRFAHGLEVCLGPNGPATPERTIVCSYHPSQRNVFTGLLTAEMFDTVLTRCRVLVGASGGGGAPS